MPRRRSFPFSFKDREEAERAVADADKQLGEMSGNPVRSARDPDGALRRNLALLKEATRQYEKAIVLNRRYREELHRR